MTKSLKELEADRKKINRQIAAQKIKKKVKGASPQNKKKFENVIRRKFPSFSNSMDNAAKNMFGN